MYKKLVTAINTRRQSQLQLTIVTNLAGRAIILHGFISQFTTPSGVFCLCQILCSNTHFCYPTHFLLFVHLLFNNCFIRAIHYIREIIDLGKNFWVNDVTRKESLACEFLSSYTTYKSHLLRVNDIHYHYTIVFLWQKSQVRRAFIERSFSIFVKFLILVKPLHPYACHYIVTAFALAYSV